MIQIVTENKKDYLDLLLLADEQENMIDKYLTRGDLYVMTEGGVKAVCVVTDEGGGVCELQNLAVAEGFQRQGLGTRMVKHVFDVYRKTHAKMLVGTGDSPATLAFYKHCGFTESHRVKNYILEHYDKPIFEDGKQLIDKVYLLKEL